ncbi:MAG: hypothetical protein JWO44_2108 [Bacteroidetes bacterium]|nr:hypothetical protein [Bacteroidota bacterium]
MELRATLFLKEWNSIGCFKRKRLVCMDGDVFLFAGIPVKHISDEKCLFNDFPALMALLCRNFESRY